MHILQAIEILKIWDQKAKYVFTKQELRKLFFQENFKTFTEGLNRLVKHKILIRACRGVYVNLNAASKDSYVIEHIAKALRQGEYNYVSLESILSEYGVISQIPIDRLTIITTGRRGICKTIFGVIEYTHTKRSFIDILEGSMRIPNRPLRIASKAIAWRDLKRVGRNVDLVDLKELNNNE